jgi:hypothetical protein
MASDPGVTTTERRRRPRGRRSWRSGIDDGEEAADTERYETPATTRQLASR